MLDFVNKTITSENTSIPTSQILPISKRISTDLYNTFSNLNFAGVYRIGSETVKDDCYIGSAYNVTLKITHHMNLLYRGEHHSKGLQDWVNANGLENIDISLLTRTTPFPDDFEAKEQYFLDLIKPKFNSVLNKRKIKIELKKVGSINYCNTRILNPFGKPIVTPLSKDVERTIIRIISTEYINDVEKQNTRPIYYFALDEEFTKINLNPVTSNAKKKQVKVVETFVRRAGVFK